MGGMICDAVDPGTDVLLMTERLFEIATGTPEIHSYVLLASSALTATNKIRLFVRTMALHVV